MNDPKQQAANPKEISTVVLMQGITSNEFYLTDTQTTVPVLRGVDLSVLRGQIFGVDGTSVVEIRLLLEIIANIRAYDAGRCVLLERGMMRKKKIILPHVFYLDDTGMVYPDMNVLEFIMFCLMKFKKDKIDLQEQMLDYLVGIGLRHIALSPIHSLTSEYRAVVLLLVSALSRSELVVFNFPENRYGEDLRAAIGHIAHSFSVKNKTLVLATQDPALLETACTHMAYLHEGRIAFAGEVGAFRSAYDRIAMIIEDENALTLEDHLRLRLPQYRYEVSGSTLTIRHDSPIADSEALPQAVYREIAAFGVAPDAIMINPKTVFNAREELLREHAVHQELL
jgi:ABC-2 type transport system ATP-binding protein